MNRYDRHEEWYRGSSETENGVTCNPALPLRDEYPQEMKHVFQTHICPPMFIAEQFTIDKISKQADCPSTDDCVEAMLHTCTHIHTCIQVHICAYIYIYTHEHTHVTFTHAYIHEHTDTHIPIHAYRHIHTIT